MRLQRATAADLTDVFALMNLAFRGGDGWAAEGDYIRGDRVRLADLEAELAGGLPLWLRRDDAGVLMGCFSLEFPDLKTGYLGMLTVAPGLQEQGLGRGLLEEAEARARQAGANRMRMSVLWVREALIAWYVRRGYAPTGETKPFPYGDDRWGLPQRDDLHFVILEKPL